MNEQIVLEMAKPYLDGQDRISYDDFENIYSFLSRKEQYEVSSILQRNGIEFIDDDEDIENEFGSDDYISEDDEDDVEDFEILYDESIFKDFDEESEDFSSSISQETIIRKDVHLSNETLIRLIHEGSAQARQDLCVRNEKLVDKYAYRYHKMAGNKLDYEDVKQAGMIGMLKAADKFDLEKGYQFSTYATWWIQQGILREIMDNGFTIRIPVHKMEQIVKILKSESRYFRVEDYYERIRLISDDTGFSIETIEEDLQIYNLFMKNASLDVPIGEEEETLLGEMIPDETVPSTEDVVLNKMRREIVEEVLETLTERERDIIRLRYGFYDGKTRTLEEVGAVYNVTRERIRQIEAKALRKMRHPNRMRRIENLRVY